MCAGSLIILGKYDSDSASSHRQDEGEVEGEEEHVVQDPEESCDDSNVEQASDGCI